MQTLNRARQLFLQHKARLTDQYGLVEQLARVDGSLPEFLFLGSSNVGKSSLLARLLDPSMKTAPKPAGTVAKRARSGNQNLIEVPRVSKKAGFTTTLSIYTLPRLLRLVDSPGYGFKSSTNQGTVVQQYLETNADAIKQAYVLIPAKRGVSPDDAAACALLAQFGVPFTFVVTKADLQGKFFNNSHDDICGMPQFTPIHDQHTNLCRELGVPLPSLPHVTSVKHSIGLDELRADILLLSGLLEVAKNKTSIK